MMQASLAIIGGFFGVVAYLRVTLAARSGRPLVNWPYTIVVIMPTNHRLMNTPPGAARAETRRMIGRWGMLHAGRSVLGLAATLIFLCAQR